LGLYSKVSAINTATGVDVQAESVKWSASTDDPVGLQFLTYGDAVKIAYATAECNEAVEGLGPPVRVDEDAAERKGDPSPLAWVTRIIDVR
jgi:hypothetical protein